VIGSIHGCKIEQATCQIFFLKMLILRPESEESSGLENSIGAGGGVYSILEMPGMMDVAAGDTFERQAS
jgi:hypothetical protein